MGGKMPTKPPTGKASLHVATKKRRHLPPCRRTEVGSKHRRVSGQTLLDDFHHQQNDDNQEDQSQTAAWSIPPITTMPPIGKRTDDGQDKDDEKYGSKSHDFGCLVLKTGESIRFADDHITRALLAVIGVTRLVIAVAVKGSHAVAAWQCGDIVAAIITGALIITLRCIRVGAAAR